MQQILFGLPRCSSRQGWPGRMPVPDGRWLHRGRGKCLWTFSFCSNARSFDRPTVAKPGEKIKVSIFIRRKGADAFRPTLAAGGSLMAYISLSEKSSKLVARYNTDEICFRRVSFTVSNFFCRGGCPAAVRAAFSRSSFN